MESPEAPVAPTFFRPHQPMIVDISTGTAHASNRIDLQGLLPKTLASHPSTSRACIIESLNDNVPDRPEIFFQPKRKSHSVADIFASVDTDNNDVLFRHDDMKPQKSIVVESNYDYTPKRKDELKLKRGATIKVIRRDGEEGWWYGEKLDGSGKKGFFPQNHVQLAKGLAKEINPNDVQFTGFLGAGGFSVVKSAIYKGREVAVKIPHSKFSKKEILEAVREEASVFQMLDHGNIVEMYGVIIGDEPALVLELCRDSLAKICSSKKNISLSEEIISNWGIQVAHGMNYLHSLNVLHRDLKAANVLIKEKVCDCLLNVEASTDEQLAHSLQARNGVCQKCDGSALNCLTLKIADLGLSKKLRVADCRMSVVGTVPYLAPEVIRDRKCSKAMDVWSFGLVLWEVLTGATPFEGLGPGAVQLQIGTFVKQKIPSSCPPDLRLIIESCWRDDPLERPTFKELIVELERFGNKFRTTDPHDQTFLETSLNTLRKSMMEEISSIAREMARKAEELQKREENLKKGERELKLKTMIFELQQTLSERPPKEKPQPPKRRQHLKCEDISKPYDLKTEISLTKNMQMIESLNRGAGIALNGTILNGSTDQLSLVSNIKHVDNGLGFATLPRTPKKFTRKNENFDRAEYYPVQQRVPSKSTPDLLKLYRLPVHNASPKLKRVNACKVKRDSARTSAEEEVDERCVEVINDKDLENLLETTTYQQSKTFLDHLATPRRVIQLPPPAKKLAADHHIRSSSTVDGHARSKLNKEEDRGFFRNIFKRDTKDRSGRITGTLPKSMITRSPLGPSTVGSSTILKNMTPSKHTRIKSPTKPSPSKAGKKKKYSVNAQSDKYDLTENSKTFMKCNERRISATPSQASAVYPVSSSPVSIYYSTDDLYSRRRAPYEKLSEASDPTVKENPLYILPSNFPLCDRTSTSAPRISSNGNPSHVSKSPSLHTSYDDRLNSSGLSTIENLSYKPPNEIKTSRTSITQITLDSPVEGGIDMDAGKRSINSLNSENASFWEDSSLLVDRSLHDTALNVDNVYVPMLTVEQNMSSSRSRFSDHCNNQKQCLVSDDRIQYITESAQAGCEYPPEIQAPSLPGAALGYRPQRPYTLDLTSPSTPAESGISTAGSSYHSFSSTDQGLQDHALPHSVDSVPRLAPPIPPRNNTRRLEDEAVAPQRQRLSPVSQSP